MKIKHSQLCAEIMEYTDDKKSFVCCLSSMNLFHYDDWKDEKDAIQLMILTASLTRCTLSSLRRQGHPVHGEGGQVCQRASEHWYRCLGIPLLLAEARAFHLKASKLGYQQGDV